MLESQHVMGGCSSRKTWGWLLLACLWALAPAHAAWAGVQLSAARVSTGTMVLSGVEASLQARAAGALHVVMTVEGVDLPAAGWHQVQLGFSGTATRGPDARWQLQGLLRLHGAPGGLLSDGQVHVVVAPDANNLAVNVAQGRATAEVALPLDQLSHARVRLNRLPLVWLQGLVAQAWSGKLTGGSMDGTLAVDVGEDGVRASGRFQLHQAGFDSSSGTVAGQGLNVRGRATIDTTTEQPRTNVDVNVSGGQLLLGSLYAALPKHDVHLALEARIQPHGIAFPQLRFTDPGALHLIGAMVLSPQGALRNLHLTRFQADLPAAYARYGKAWLASAGFADLRVGGHLSGSVWLDSHGLRAFDFQASKVDVGGGRVAVRGLNGALDWSREGNGKVTTLAWQRLSFYQVALGAASSRWQTRDARLTLLAPVDVPVLGGQVHLRSLRWSPQGKQHLQTSLAITGVDVGRLCDALGWPHFSGTLAGSIPGLSYVDDRIDLAGGLSLNVFGGFVDVTSLSLEHVFSGVPVLVGDVHMRDLDLKNLTGVFDFGRITGRLGGSVQGLRMVDWKPVAFKAKLETEGDGGRISQRAVNNLTSMGGGGLASGLQGAVLKFFDSFGYRRIGLHCTLEGSVCHMGGLKPADDGYLIVQGRGLPHLSVIGHQHEVSWPVLMARLRAAIESGGPVIK